MTLKHTATRAGFTAAAGLAALFFGSAVASAQPAPAPAPAPGTENRAAEEQPREEEQKPADCGQWCEVIEAAKQLPPPNWSAVDVPKIADVSVPVSFGLGLPDVVPDIPISLVPDFPVSVGAPSINLPAAQLPPPPEFKLPPPPKFEIGPPKLPF